jgi:hypothetical protein
VSCEFWNGDIFIENGPFALREPVAANAGPDSTPIAIVPWPHRSHKRNDCFRLYWICNTLMRMTKEWERVGKRGARGLVNLRHMPH